MMKKLIAITILSIVITFPVYAQSIGGWSGSGIPTSYLDTDGTLTANSDVKVATQKATKTYADGKQTYNANLQSYTETITAGGTADALTADFATNITPAAGTRIRVIAASANATTTPTLAVDGTTARTIVKQGGTALVVGDIAAAGHILELQYDLANTRWELLNPKYPIAIGTDVPGISGTVTDEQLACWESTDGTAKIKSCGAKTTDNSTASHAIYKDYSGYVANQVLSIDAHAASTTITLIAGICPIIHNASQADSNIDNTLPAVGAGKCFVALATSVEADKYWRLTAAAANTVCLNRTCGKDYIQFDTPAVGDTFTCISDGTNWYCYDYDSSATAGDL
jgi:hypothetical protein